jgi:putative oxidoreductase
MNALLQKAEVAYGWLLKAVNGLQSPFLLLIRVYWGWLFLQSGIEKFGHIDKVVSFFTDLGIPARPSMPISMLLWKLLAAFF